MLYLHGIGHFHPETIIDNAFLASLEIGVDPNWIEERVGITERRTSLSLDYIRRTRNQDTRASAEGSTISTIDMGREAAQIALRRAGLAASDVGMVIAGGCTPEMLIPAEASRVAAALGIEVQALDVQAACASFATQVHFLNQMRPEALPDFVLIVSVEAFTRTINYGDRGSAVLFGDGASAAIFSSNIASPNQVLSTSFMADPAGYDKVTIPAGGHFEQEGHAVQMFAIRKTSELFERMRQSGNAAGEGKQVFIGHQANLRMLQSVCKRLGIPENEHLSNVRKFGNCGAAGAPSVLSQNWDALGNASINMAVVGSGLAWGSVRMTKNLVS
ncbi:MAG: ketoacyl-ACP synthase III [Terriglobales bacterium]